MRPAYIRWHGRVNGQERTATLRSGAKGTGEVLATVKYWPTSGVSMDATYNILAEQARNEGYEIVATDRDED